MKSWGGFGKGKTGRGCWVGRDGWGGRGSGLVGFFANPTGRGWGGRGGWPIGGPKRLGWQEVGETGQTKPKQAAKKITKKAEKNRRRKEQIMRWRLDKGRMRQMKSWRNSRVKMVKEAEKEEREKLWLDVCNTVDSRYKGSGWTDIFFPLFGVSLIANLYL